MKNIRMQTAASVFKYEIRLYGGDLFNVGDLSPKFSSHTSSFNVFATPLQFTLSNLLLCKLYWLCLFLW